MSLRRLVSWTDVPDIRVKHFSGTATYLRDLRIATGLLHRDFHLVLDLGEIANLATVWVNGTELGVLWRPPYRIDVTRAVKPGANRLRVDVTNTWRNRLLGDRDLPEAERSTWVLPFSEGGSTYSPIRQSDTLVPAGLIGPVGLRWERRAITRWETR
jgi:hypothetical protein